MKPSDLAFWLSEFVTDFIDIEGRIFIARNGESVEQLKLRTTEYETLEKAQQWLNIVLIDAFLDEVLGKDWEIDDPGVDEILTIYAKAWAYQIESRFPNAGLSVQFIKYNNDIGIKLIQS